MNDALADFTHNLLRYGKDTHAVLTAADATPDDPTLNAYAAATAMFGMTPAAHAAASAYLVRARSTAASVDERMLVDAVAAWQNGDRPEAIALHRARLRVRPDDLAASKICQLHHIDLGDFEGMLATIRGTMPHHAENHYVLGQLAFALEETGQVAEARELASRALAEARAAGEDDPWSVHALIHAHYRAGELRQSIALVYRYEPLWERSGTFMSTHAWWHAAIAELDLDQPRSALELYDMRLALVDVACVQSLVARISLLARLRLWGVDVGDRWKPLLATLEERAVDGINPFLDVHYVYGLALAGKSRAARAAAARLGGLASAAALALIAEAEGDSERAANTLGRIVGSLQCLGGSHEQREIYELAGLHASLKAGLPVRAETLSSHRLVARSVERRHLN